MYRLVKVGVCISVQVGIGGCIGVEATWASPRWRGSFSCHLKLGAAASCASERDR